MSRSFKHPGWSMPSRVRFSYKRVANRRVRRAKVVPNYGGFKRLFETWIIRDWNIRCFCGPAVSCYWCEGRGYKLRRK